MSKVMFSALPKDRDFASLVTVLPGVSTESFAGGVDRAGASKPSPAGYPSTGPRPRRTSSS